jgi:hypothetical protein
MSENEMNRRTALGAVGATVAMGAAAAAAAQVPQKPSQAPERSMQAKGLKLFEKVDPARITKGAPPLVFYPVPDGYIRLDSEALKGWEAELRERLGSRFEGPLTAGTESCSAGCSDDCDQ